MSTYTVNSDEQIKEEDIKKRAFFNGFKKAIDQWEKEHPGKMPPVIQDKDGSWKWINRKERRRLEKKNAKAR